MLGTEFLLSKRCGCDLYRSGYVALTAERLSLFVEGIEIMSFFRIAAYGESNG